MRIKLTHEIIKLSQFTGIWEIIRIRILLYYSFGTLIDIISVIFSINNCIYVSAVFVLKKMLFIDIINKIKYRIYFFLSSLYMFFNIFINY